MRIRIAWNARCARPQTWFEPSDDITSSQVGSGPFFWSIGSCKPLMQHAIHSSWCYCCNSQSRLEVVGKPLVQQVIAPTCARFASDSACLEHSFHQGPVVLIVAPTSRVQRGRNTYNCCQEAARGPSADRKAQQKPWTKAQKLGLWVEDEGRELAPDTASNPLL